MIAASPGPNKLLLLSADENFANSVRAAFSTDVTWELSIVSEWLSAQELKAEISKAAVVIVDVSSGHRDELLALQRIVSGMAHRHSFIVALDHGNAAVVRKLVQ